MDNERTRAVLAAAEDLFREEELHGHIAVIAAVTAGLEPGSCSAGTTTTVTSSPSSLLKSPLKFTLIYLP